MKKLHTFHNKKKHGLYKESVSVSLTPLFFFSILFTFRETSHPLARLGVALVRETRVSPAEREERAWIPESALARAHTRPRRPPQNTRTFRRSLGVFSTLVDRSRCGFRSGRSTGKKRARWRIFRASRRSSPCARRSATSSTWSPSNRDSSTGENRYDPVRVHTGIRCLRNSPERTQNWSRFSQKTSCLRACARSTGAHQ